MKKKIIISGTTSFIGHHLCQELSRDYEVVATITRPEDEYQGLKKERLQNLKGKCFFEVLDLTSKEATEDLIRRIKPNFFIQHAGYTVNYTSQEYDLAVANRINVNPLNHIFPLLKTNGCEGIIITGSSAEYSDSDLPHEENEECKPSTPYGESKLLETQKAIDLGKKYNLSTRVIRVFNTFGKLDASNKLIPLLVEKLKTNSEVELSPCTQVRSFIQVKCLVDIYRFCLEDLARGGEEIFNGDYKEGVVLKDFICEMARSLNKPQGLLKFGSMPMRSIEAPKLVASPKKLLQSGYTNSLSMEQEISLFLQDL
ncbi:MAG: NAD-dependent epimerase/dehydratase family protein [Bacteriovoracaceae bacterium]